MSRTPPLDAVCMDCDEVLDIDYQDRIIGVTADGDVITELVCITHLFAPLETEDATP